MANISVTYTFSNGTTADASQVNANFTDIINGTSDGTKDFTIAALVATGNAELRGHVTLGNGSIDDITLTGSLASSIPIKTTNTYDIGSSTLGLAGIYFGANSQTVRVVGSASMSATWTMTLPVSAGSAGQGLQNSGSGVLVWAPLQTDINSVSSADYTITDTDGYGLIYVTTGNTNRTVTLPTAADNTDRDIVIKKADTGTGYVIVDGEGAETIDGATTKRLVDQYDFIKLKCTGTTWVIVDMGIVTHSHVRVENGNGYGSTNTLIRRFTNIIINTGNAITYADSATDGGSFTINQDGMYSMCYSDIDDTSGATLPAGISLNTTQPTTSIDSITSADRLAIFMGPNSGLVGIWCAAIRKLVVGDVIRAHTGGNLETTSIRASFSITRIGPC